MGVQYVHSRDQLYWMTKWCLEMWDLGVFILLPVFCLNLKTKSVVNSRRMVGLLRSLISMVIMGLLNALLQD